MSFELIFFESIVLIIADTLTNFYKIQKKLKILKNKNVA